MEAGCDGIRAAIEEESSPEEQLWGAPALTEEGRCRGSHENSGASEADLGSHPFPAPAEADVCLLFHSSSVQSQPRAHAKDPLPESSALFTATDHPC